MLLVISSGNVIMIDARTFVDQLSNMLMIRAENKIHFVFDPNHKHIKPLCCIVWPAHAVTHFCQPYHQGPHDYVIYYERKIY